MISHIDQITNDDGSTNVSTMISQVDQMMNDDGSSQMF